ncbi:hypothetical protein [Clostridium sporogenes]|uniref:hypothetical protein n=1 Tax=Clostridium sporogenes TaxID=1509 RepID=UPI0013D719F5|nr:hypothetical protein [Clostridium sporogenes]
MVDKEAEEAIRIIGQAGEKCDRSIVKVLNGLVELLVKKNIITENEVEELYKKGNIS